MVGGISLYRIFAWLGPVVLLTLTARYGLAPALHDVRDNRLLSLELQKNSYSPQWLDSVQRTEKEWVEKLTGDFQAMKGRLVPADTADLFPEIVRKSLEGRGLQLMKMETTRSDEAGLLRRGVRLEGLGTYRGLMELLREMYHKYPRFYVTALNARPDKNKLRFSLSVKCYGAAGEESSRKEKVHER